MVHGLASQTFSRRAGTYKPCKEMSLVLYDDAGCRNHVWQTQICRVMAGQQLKDEDWKACFLLNDDYYSRC